jgi:diadenosine tetraphosphate (Ap4A) HIT family hydrolase
MSLYCYGNARTPEQTAEMRSLEARGLCLFCPDGLRGHERQQILFETRHWAVTPNEFPYQGTALHLLLVPHEHAGDLLDLPAAAQQDFWTALGLIRERYQLRYYGLGVRNGDCRFTGATIRHVHAHVLVGDPEAADGPVRMRFSPRPGQLADEPAPPGSG